jgi:soluble lytic murein transglycosylase
MFSKSLVKTLLFTCLAIGVASPLAGSKLHFLIDAPAQSLRGQTIDLDDDWSGARLLAHFGEVTLAYDLLRRRSENVLIDPRVERFEARLLTESGLYARADSVLALQPDSDDSSSYYLYWLRRSRLNLLEERHERALEFLALIDGISYPAFDPYKDYLGMRALMKAERFPEACALGEARLAKGVPKALSPRFDEHLFEAYVQIGKLDKALEFVRVLGARRSISGSFAPLFIREVDLLFMKGDTVAAMASALDLLQGRRTAALSLDIIDKVLERVPMTSLSDEGMLEFCPALIRGGRLPEADRMASILGKRRLTEERKEKRRLILAELYFKEKRYNKSYKHLARRFDDAPMERRAKLMRARIFRKTGQTVRSAEAYDEFSTAFPYDGKAPEALYMAADLYLRAGNGKRAMDMLDRVLRTYPSHEYAKRAALRSAGYHVERKRYDRGVSILEKAFERSRRRNEELLYYLADVYDRMGKAERAAQFKQELMNLNPISFYLRPRIGSSFTQPLTASDGKVVLEGEVGLLDFLKSVFEKREAAYDEIREVLGEARSGEEFRGIAVFLERGRVFLQAGFKDWAEYELKVAEAERRLPARIWLELGVLYDDFALHWNSVRAFQRVYYSLKLERRRELDDEFRLLLYPIPYPALIFENCTRNEISPHLVYAMVREESRFDLNAVSSAGAQGLMQLMPETGEHVASELGFPDGVTQNLFVPEINLTFGVWYASHLYKRLDGDPLMMLAAYNAGMGNARRWFSGGQSNASIISAVDGIDYKETRGYVKRIVRSAHVYHSYYFAPDAVVRQPLH